MIGSLNNLPYVLAESEQNFLTPTREQALIWGDLVPQMIVNVTVPRWRAVAPEQMRWVALHMRRGEDLLAAATLGHQDTGDWCCTSLGRYATPARVEKIGDDLSIGNFTRASANVLPSELFALGMDPSLKPVAREVSLIAIEEISRGEPRKPRPRQHLGSLRHSQADAHAQLQPELLNLRTFPTLMGYSSRILAETWESNGLYYAALADEMGIPAGTVGFLCARLDSGHHREHLRHASGRLARVAPVTANGRGLGAPAERAEIRRRQYGSLLGSARDDHFWTECSNPWRRRPPRAVWPEQLAAVGIAGGAVTWLRAQDQDRATFRVKVDMVVLSFTVTDQKGRYVNGLKPKDFRFLEDDIPQKPATFTEGNRTPVRYCRTAKRSPSCAPMAKRRRRQATPVDTRPDAFTGTNVFVLFDTSNYMYRGFVYASDSIAEFIRGLDKADSIAVYTYSRNLNRAVPLNRDLGMAISGLRKAVAGDDSALYNCLLLTLRDAAKVPGRKVVIVFSNGPDNASMVAPDDVRAVAEDEGIPIYVISTNEVTKDPALARLMVWSVTRGQPARSVA